MGSGLVTGEEGGDRDQPRPAPGPTILPNMPKDYFEAPEVEEEFLTEEEKHVKVIEFVYQVTRKSCDIGDYTGWLQDGKIIEEVIFKSCPTPLGKKQRAAPTDMKTNDRVEKIINDLFEFGVSIEVLFDVDDLVKAKNIPKVTSCLLEIKNMVYTGQGRSKLSSTLDGVTRAPFRCSVCKEKFPRSDQLKYHMCDNHPELIEPSLRQLLMKMRK